VEERPAAVTPSSSCGLGTRVVHLLSTVPGGLVDLLTKKVIVEMSVRRSVGTTRLWRTQEQELAGVSPVSTWHLETNWGGAL
jgi:hypothetical protein